MLCTHKTTIFCQFGNLEICPNFANPYLTQFSSISGGNCITTKCDDPHNDTLLLLGGFEDMHTCKVASLPLYPLYWYMTFWVSDKRTCLNCKNSEFGKVLPYYTQCLTYNLTCHACWTLNQMYFETHKTLIIFK